VENAGQQIRAAHGQHGAKKHHQSPGASGVNQEGQPTNDTETDELLLQEIPEFSRDLTYHLSSGLYWAVLPLMLSRSPSFQPAKSAESTRIGVFP